MLGLYAFFYGCLHLMTYVWLYAGWSWAAMVDDISQRRFITAGLAAWLMMVPLALTSTTGPSASSAAKTGDGSTGSPMPPPSAA